MPDDSFSCDPNGCTHIAYVKGQNVGTLHLGIFDLSSDGAEATEIKRPFVDGVAGGFEESWLLDITGFRVDLIADLNALLTLIIGGGNSTIPIDIVRDQNCRSPERA